MSGMEIARAKAREKHKELITKFAMPYDTCLHAAANSIAASRWTLFMANIFGKKTRHWTITHNKVTIATYRGKRYLLEYTQ